MRNRRLAFVSIFLLIVVTAALAIFLSGEETITGHAVAAGTYYCCNQAGSLRIWPACLPGYVATSWYACDAYTTCTSFCSPNAGTIAGTTCSCSGSKSQACSDTDAIGEYNFTKQITTGGTCTGFNGVGGDTCTGNELLEYTCNAQGSCQIDPWNCEQQLGQGATCFNGACLYPGTVLCTDTDGGENYYAAGTATGISGPVQDKCVPPPTPSAPGGVPWVSNSILLEAVCGEEGQATDMEYNCNCIDGVCVTGSCYDPDGDNPDVFGECQSSSGTYADSCGEAGQLTEYMCLNDACSPTFVTCDGECIEGKCASPQECTDSDSGDKPFNYGEVTYLGLSPFGDFCSGEYVYERLCSEVFGLPGESIYDCSDSAYLSTLEGYTPGATYSCVDGACKIISQVETCRDSDEGDSEYTTYGALSGSSFSDYQSGANGEDLRADQCYWIEADDSTEWAVSSCSELAGLGYCTLIEKGCGLPDYQYRMEECDACYQGACLSSTAATRAPESVLSLII